MDIPPDDRRTVGSALANVSLDDALVYGALILTIIGSVSPWATSPLSSASGFDGDGKWTALLALVAAVLLWFGRRKGATFGCLLIAGVAIYDAIHIHHALQKVVFNGTQLDHVGWGVYLTAVAGAVAFLLMLRSTDLRPGAPIQL